MTPIETLCNCQVDTAKSCCEPTAAPFAAPLEIKNPPGLAAIRYRSGTFTAFRQAMLNDLAKQTPLKSNPQASDDSQPLLDYQTMFIELWAYLADVLTFYQERIANEAFLQTATQRDSLLRLCRLIDYRFNPGSGASGTVAFKVEKGKKVVVPAGFRTGNKPTPGNEQAVFETESAITAIGSYSEIPLASAVPTNQFAALDAYQSLLSLSAAPARVDAAKAIYLSIGNAVADSVTPLPLLQRIHAKPTELTDKDRELAELLRKIGPATRFESRAVHKPDQRAVVLKGTSNRLAAGDFVLLVGDAGTMRCPTRRLKQVDTVNVDQASDTTTISWTETPGEFYTNVTLFAFRVQAAPLGSNAPNWNSLSPTLINHDALSATKNAPFEANWDPWEPTGGTDPLKDRKSVVGFPRKTFGPSEETDNIDLDTDYPNAPGTGWLALVTNEGRRSKILQVVGKSSVTNSEYAATTKVTRIKIRPQITAGRFPLRKTMILTGSEPLSLQDNLPLPEPVFGSTLILAGKYGELKKGQKVILRGQRIDLDTLKVVDEVSAEETVLDAEPIVDATGSFTTIHLKPALLHQYSRSSTVLLANVVGSTQGETVRDEVLGSGDGGPFQAFALKKKPLTFLTGADPQGLLALRDTLQITVNGVHWTEQPTLAESAADAQEFTTALDDADQATVTFGDGIHGAKPPKGKDNIRARYRRGMGENGNVESNGVSLLLDAIPGLQKVTNPLPTFGGLDPERIDQIRRNAPGSLRTFGRSVSVQDYASLALNFPGVAKASAVWIDHHAARAGVIPEPYVRLTIATTEPTLKTQPTFLIRLREFLDARRDPTVSLRLVFAEQVFIEVHVDVEIEDRYPHGATTAAVREALSPGKKVRGTPGFFGSDRLQLGQSLNLSDLYLAIHSVPGVRRALVKRFGRAPADPQSLVENSILLQSNELAVLQNSLTDPALDLVHSEGGFVDS